MRYLFDRLSHDEDGNAVIDWVVLMAGMVLMAISVVITVTANVDTITDDTMKRVEAVESSLPS